MARLGVTWDGIWEGHAIDMPATIDDSTIEFDASEAGGSAQVGLAVRWKAGKTVELVGDGEAVAGRLVLVEADGTCLVRVRGPVQLPGGEGATLTIGKAIVGDLDAVAAEGYIREVNETVAAELAVARGQILDPSTATAVWVLL